MLALLGPVLSWFANFLSGPLLQNAVNAYKARLAQDNNVDKILADVAAKEIAVNQQQRQLDLQLNQMEQGRWWTAAPRALVQWALAIWIFKVVVWDKVLGLGITDGIKDPLVSNAFNLIVAMWFGGRTLEKITQTVVNRIK